MLNHIAIMGRLTRDPELRRTGNGTAVASFSVACERDVAPQGQEKEVDYIDCVAWRGTAEFVSQYFSKGRMIAVDGRLQIRKYTDRSGNSRTAAEVVVDHCYFGDSKKDAAPGNSYNGNSYGGNAYAGNYYGGNNGGYQNSYGQPSGGYGVPVTPPASDFAMLEDDDAQLPF